MSLTDYFKLTSIAPPVKYAAWSPKHFTAYQWDGYLDIYADLSYRKPTILRLYSNRDVAVYGELILRNPAIRTFDTLVINCTDSTRDSVSFCTGGAGGFAIERARVTKDGDIRFKGGLQGYGTAGLTILSKDIYLNHQDMGLDAKSVTVIGRNTGSTDPLFIVEDAASNSLFEVLKSGRMFLNDHVFAATTPDQSGFPGLVIAHRFELANRPPAAGCGPFTDDISLEESILVVDVVVVKTGSDAGGTDTATLSDGTNDITDDMSIGVDAGMVVRPSALDSTYATVSSTLRVKRQRSTDTDDIACNVYVIGVKTT